MTRDNLIRIAAEAAHKALEQADPDGGWHYPCMDDEPRECWKGDEARALLVENVIPAVLEALEQAGVVAS